MHVSQCLHFSLMYISKTKGTMNCATWIKNSSLPPANYVQRSEDPRELSGQFHTNYLLCYDKSTKFVDLFTGGCRRRGPRRRRRRRGGWAGDVGARRHCASGSATAGTARAPCAPTSLSPRRRRACRCRLQHRCGGAPAKSGRRACCGRGIPERPACAPYGGCTGTSRGGSSASTYTTAGCSRRRTMPASARTH
jgi:hypothetical protein